MSDHNPKEMPAAKPPVTHKREATLKQEKLAAALKRNLARRKAAQTHAKPQP